MASLHTGERCPGYACSVFGCAGIIQPFPAERGAEASYAVQGRVGTLRAGETGDSQDTTNHKSPSNAPVHTPLVALVT